MSALFTRRGRLVCDQDIVLHPIGEAHDLPAITGIRGLDEFTRRLELEFYAFARIELTFCTDEAPRTEDRIRVSGTNRGAEAVK